jgi:DNA-directed RNA polymerase specialized sigma subunit
MMTNHNTANEVNNLIDIAQHAPKGSERSEAINKLWDMYGDMVTGITVKKSYLHDSDHSMHGMTAAERRSNLQEQAFDTFRKAVLSFDLSRPIPFMAYVAQKINWQQLDFKRCNAKHSRKERATDFSCEGGYGSNSSENTPDLSSITTLSQIDTESPMASSLYDDFENRAYLEDAVHVLFNKLQKEKKLLEYAITFYQVCQDGEKATDAEIAKRMGCSRANTNHLHKKLIDFLKDSDIANDCRLALAA